MWKSIALAIVVLVVGLLAYATTRPATFEVQRSVVIRAPAEKIYPLIEDFHRWTVWSPWEKLDPLLHRAYSGAPSGPGAAYAWEGNAKVGRGRMEITAAQPPSRLTIRLDFLKPIEGHDTAVFVLRPQGDETEVTWTMRGPSPYIAKLMGIFVSMDSLVGKDFEAGLANLKAAAEQPR
ncbi:MAG: SRPBCC family protein [Proteobacteria bacterium]|nr:SRPBCC family protein [Pseudomonadota bacterium]